MTLQKYSNYTRYSYVSFSSLLDQAIETSPSSTADCDISSHQINDEKRTCTSKITIFLAKLLAFQFLSFVIIILKHFGCVNWAHMTEISSFAFINKFFLRGATEQSIR